MHSTQLVYPIENSPRESAIKEVAAGVNWIRMPIPIAGLEHINLWLLEDNDSWTIVDTGLNTEVIRDLWEQIFSHALGGKPVSRVICTHFHPDHMGLAGWLVERWNPIALWCTFAEWAFGRMLWMDQSEEIATDVTRFYRRLGWSDEQINNRIKRRHRWFAKVVYPLPNGIRRIEDGETFAIGQQRWQVIVGRGHSPEHACLYCAELGVLIGGDQVLPRISPHIGVYPSEPDGNPLADYLRSLRTLLELPDETLILPSHGEPYRGLHSRLHALNTHHEERLERLASACENPLPAVDLIPAMFSRTLRETDQSLATSEGLAHLNFLVRSGRLVRDLGADGVYRYRTA